MTLAPDHLTDNARGGHRLSDAITDLVRSDILPTAIAWLIPMPAITVIVLIYSIFAEPQHIDLKIAAVVFFLIVIAGHLWLIRRLRRRNTPHSNERDQP